MNTYKKFAPNVFLAKCEEEYEKGDTITVTTKYGKENESIVFNLVMKKDGFFYYSIVRADGFNAQEYAKRKAEKLENLSENAQRKSNEAYSNSDLRESKTGIPFGQPILVGHHSERKHRKVIERAHREMEKSVEFSNKAQEYENRAEYWKNKQDVINLSMPESLEYFKFKLEEAQKEHAGLKDGTIPRRHSYSLTYAKKAVNEVTKKLELARRLWG